MCVFDKISTSLCVSQISLSFYNWYIYCCWHFLPVSVHVIVYIFPVATTSWTGAKKEENDISEMTNNSKKGLNLSNVSLIVFDEVRYTSNMVSDAFSVPLFVTSWPYVPGVNSAEVKNIPTNLFLYNINWQVLSLSFVKILSHFL